jgi:hypothetical protein
MKDTYTVELYKTDKRYKGGMKLFSVKDVENTTYEELDAQKFDPSKFVRFIRKTYVTRTNMMTKQEYQERYDTPHFCSPSSESYWSM